MIHKVTGTNGSIHIAESTWLTDRDELDIKKNSVGSTTISQYDYAVNNLSQRTAVATSGSAFAAVTNVAWGYGALGQVVKADLSTIR